MDSNLSVWYQKPRHIPGLSLLQGGHRTAVPTVGLFLALIVFAVVGSGCGPTAPRFRSGERTAPKSVVRTESVETGKDTTRAHGEDVEATAEGAENVVSGKRTFKTEKNASISNLDQARMMREISKMMGVRYKLGGLDEQGIDCSAYTMRVYKNSVGVQLPRSSAEQFKIGKPVEPADLKFGDLVFFNTTGEEASHVGIYLGDDLFAHASVSLGVTISSLDSFYFEKRYVGARRIVP